MKLLSAITWHGFRFSVVITLAIMMIALAFCLVRPFYHSDSDDLVILVATAIIVYVFVRFLFLFDLVPKTTLEKCGKRPHRHILSKRATVVIGIAWLLLWVSYVTSYLMLSRPAFAQARQWNAKGFWFLKPKNTDSRFFWNYTLVQIYRPAIAVDHLLGTGMWPACEPLWGLSK